MTLARYSPVAPISLLHDLAEHEVKGEEITLGGYLLMLAHDVLENQAAYKTLAGDVRHRYDRNAFIMMDNSVVELGRPMPIDDVRNAALIVDADVIMTPDVLGSFSRTQQVVERDFNKLLDSSFDLMKIPQGASVEELIRCVDWLQNIFETHRLEHDYWGIPRWIANKLGSREKIIKYILMTGHEGTKVHLLGMSKNMYDDLHCTRIPGVIGIDSANPLVNGHYGFDLAYNTYRHLERGDYWDRTKANEKIITNVRNMHAWVSNSNR